MARAANTADYVLTTAIAALDTPANYNLNQLPGTTNDMVFNSSSYSVITYTLNSTALTPGSLDDLDATQAITIAGSQSITLGGGSDAIAGSAASDQIYVATSANLNLSTTPIVLTTTPATGTFDVAGTLTVSGVISGNTNGFTKIGTGTLSLAGSNTFGGGFNLSGGTVVLQRDSTGSVGAVTSGALGTGTVILAGGSLLANSTNNFGNQKVLMNAVNVVSGTTLLGANSGSANLVFTGPFTGIGTLSDPTSGTTATSAIFAGDLSNFQGTFSYQNTGALTNFRFGINTGTTSSPVTGETVNASQANFVVNESGSSTRNLALEDNTSGSVFEMGSLSGNGVVDGAFMGSGSQTVNGYIIGALGTNTTFSGKLGDSTSGFQADFSVTKVGTGSLTLSGTASQYQGATTIENGSLVAGANVPASGAGAFGSATSAIALGDATTLASNLSSSLLISGAFTVARPITVGSGTGTPTGGTYTIGGSTDNSATVSGNIALNQSLTVTQAANASTNFLLLSGVISDNNPGVPTVTFAGPGNIHLSNANIYSGATNVTGGTLSLTGSGAINSSSAITINGSAAKFVASGSTAVSPSVILAVGTVDGTGTINTLSVANLATNVVTNGAGTFGPLSIGALTFNGAAQLNVQENGTAPGLSIASLTTTPANGQITVNPSDSASWAIGTYNLASIALTNDTGNSFTLGTVIGLSAGGAATLTDTATASASGFLQLNVTNIGNNPKWTGLDSTNWVVGTTGPNFNWKSISSGTPANYSNGQSALFDDSASSAVSPGVVTIPTTVTPSSTMFNNSSIVYTVSGAGGIGGVGGLTLSGTQPVVLDTVNSYTGTTTIGTGSILQLGDGTTGHDGTIANTAGVTDNGTLIYNRFGADTATYAISGTGLVVMSGSGFQTINAVNGYSGGTNLSSGTLNINNNSALGTGPLNIQGGTIDNTNTAIVTLSNAENWNGNFTYGGTTALNLGTAPITMSGNRTVTTGGTATLTVGNAIGDGGNNYTLSLAGTGSIILNGQSTYSGGTNVSGGTVALGVSSVGTSPMLTSGPLGTGTLTVSGGTVVFAVNNMTVGNAINASSGTTNLNAASANFNLTGNISGSGNLIYNQTANPSTLTLSGDDSGFTGTFNQSSSANNALGFNSASSGSAAATWLLNNSFSTRTKFGIPGGGTVSFGALSGSSQGLVNNIGGTVVNLSVGALNTNTTFSGSIFGLGANPTGGAGDMALTKVGTGMLTLTGSNSFTGGTTVNSGTLNFAAPNALPIFSSLTINSTGVATAASHNTSSAKNTLFVSNLSIAGSTGAWSGLLDLANNDMVVQNGNLAQLTNQAAQGYNGGTWNGTGGIVSSAAASDSTHLTALGVIQNSTDGTTGGSVLYTAFDGAIASAATDVLLKYTYYGDANLDGTVDGSDYSRIDNGYINNLTGWFNGDFNYDGVIDGSDYTLIDNAFNTQGAQISAEIASPTAQIAGSGTSAVPEPTTLGLLGIGAVGLLGRRRRCR